MAETDDKPAARRSPILLRIEPGCPAQKLSERYALAVAAGFDGLEWPLCPVSAVAGPSPVAAGEGPFGLAETAELMIEALAGRCRAIEVDQAADEVTAHLLRASRLHARCLNLTIPPVGRNDTGGFARYQQAVNFVCGLLRRVRFEAEAAGVAVAIEAGGGGTFLSPVELRDLIDAANSWAVGVCVDTDRIARFGLVDDWLITLKHRVHSVRFPNDPRVALTQAVPEGAPADRAALQAALNEIAYDRPIIVKAEQGL